MKVYFLISPAILLHNSVAMGLSSARRNKSNNSLSFSSPKLWGQLLHRIISSCLEFKLNHTYIKIDFSLML